MVVNNSATVNGEIDGVRRDQPVVLHAATRLDPDTWVVELRTAPDAAEPVLDAVAGETIGVGELPVTLLEPYPHAGSSPTGAGNRLWRAHVEGDLRALLDRHGRPIAYGYLDRRYPLAAYQSVFSQVPGSAEMASAGRPFTDALITRLVAQGHRRRPDHPAHRGLLAGGRRGAAVGVVPRARRHGAARRAHPRARWPGRRHRHHGDPRARVSRPRRDDPGVVGMDGPRGHAGRIHRSW